MVLNNPTKHTVLAALVSLYAGDTLEVWSGTVPGVDAAPAGTKLLSLILPNPAFSAPTGGAIAKTGTWKTNAALASGVPTFYRIVSPGGEVTQGSAAMNSGAEMIITDPDDATATQILANRAFEVVSCTISLA